MGDAKRKSETEMEKISKVAKIEKVEKEQARSALFEELRDDLFREAAKLVSEDPTTRIAILIKPPSSESESTIHSFGFPSADGVVQRFLDDTCPAPASEDAAEENDDDDDDDEEDDDDDEEEDFSPRRFWWEDQKLQESMDAEELQVACDKMLILQKQLQVIREAETSGNQEDLNNDKGERKP